MAKLLRDMKTLSRSKAMTEEQIEQKARQRAEELENNQTLGVYDDDESLAYDKGYNSGEVAGYEEGYIAGATENGIVLHDLRKSPNDLPRQDETFTTKVSIPVMTYPLYQFAEYYFDEKKWFSQGEKINVIGWCEIPKLEE